MFAPLPTRYLGEIADYLRLKVKHDCSSCSLFIYLGLLSVVPFLLFSSVLFVKPLPLYIYSCAMSFLLGLDEAEAFGDVELMAEFSLLNVVQNLRQGKMGTDLLETLEVRLGRDRTRYFDCFLWYPRYLCVE